MQRRVRTAGTELEVLDRILQLETHASFAVSMKEPDPTRPIGRGDPNLSPLMAGFVREAVTIVACHARENR